MRVRVKAVNGWSQIINVCETDSVGAVRQRVSEVYPKQGISADQVQLAFRDQVIATGQLTENRVHDGAELMVVITKKKQMEVTVLRGTERITLQVEPSETVDNLKRMLSEKLKVSVDEQIIQFKQEEITSGQLRHYDVCHGALLQLVIRSIGVFVVGLDGKTHTIDIKTSDKVENFKDKVYEKTRVLQSQQRLIFCSKQLENGHTLGHYGIKLHSTIQLTGRLRGG